MKWGSVKKARQQNKRMKEKGIVSEASVIFEESQRVIRESNMSRAQKSVAMEAAAQQFLESGMGTIKGIEEQFEQFIKTFPEDEEIDDSLPVPTQGLIEELANNDPKKMVQYMDADERSRKEMEARHFSGSSAIQQLAEMQQALGKSTQWFYESLREVSIFSYINRDASPDQLTAFISELEEEY